MISSNETKLCDRNRVHFPKVLLLSKHENTQLKFELVLALTNYRFIEHYATTLLYIFQPIYKKKKKKRR